ncbi:trehalase family glycosidase [Catalinimonas niigatensis]|uniref:trehalase family glycosidase n=1 Tax=Catalinimonas niigatensis TaxID=1397264 RepID=UPI002666A54C|nr:trehalase family glycosidase [Catalinimonas niigatensis]WPP51158.1 trehalase family glycosidase [Catalinimonas niigatensis]
MIFWVDRIENVFKTSVTYRRVVYLNDNPILNRFWDDLPMSRSELYKEDYELAHSIDRNNEVLYRDIHAACKTVWNFRSCWFRNGENLASIQTTEIIPVDLYSLMFQL